MQRRRKEGRDPPPPPPVTDEQIAAIMKSGSWKDEKSLRLILSTPVHTTGVEEDDEDDETCVCKNRECEVVVDCDYVCSSCSHPFCEDHHMKHCSDCSKRLCESCFREEDEDELDMCRKCTDEYHQSDHLDGLEHATIGYRQGGVDPYKNDE